MTRKGENKEERATKRGGLKVRIYPNREQQKQLVNLFGAVRWVYNWGLTLRRDAYKYNGEQLNYNATSARLTQVKQEGETSWLYEVSHKALQQSLRDLDRAFRNFFAGRARFPRLKKRRGKQSAGFGGDVKVREDAVRIPKIGWIRAKITKEIAGTVKTVYVSKTPTGKYYASISIDEGVLLPEPIRRIDADKVKGIDVGLTHLAITDDGEKTPNPRHLRQAEKNLRKCHKALSRKKKGSSNRAKARIKLAHAYEKLANTRHDHQHKLSRRWVDESQAISTETLRVKNMLKNRRLAKHISDVSWNSLLSKVEYKCKWGGKRFVQIDSWFASSKTCSECNNTVDELTLGDRSWTCSVCLTEHDRDINAAINIKREGIRLLQAAGQTVYTCGDRDKPCEMQAAVREAGILVP